MIPSRRSHSRLRSASSHMPMQSAQPTHTRPQTPGRSRSQSQSDIRIPVAPSVHLRREPSRSAMKPTKARIAYGRSSQPHFGFTTFSAHPVTYKRHQYPTVQHLYQASKFFDGHPEIAERIRRSAEPTLAISEAEKYKEYTDAKWPQMHIKLLDEFFYLKFTQHPDLMRELLSTGDAELLENSTSDSYWGVGDGGLGRNELGKSVERVRARIRDAMPGSTRSVPSAPSSKTRWAAPPEFARSHSAAAMCHVCQERPQVDPTSRICGYSCGVKALSLRFPLCDYCHKHERQPGKPFCGQSCAFKLMEVIGPKTDIPCYNCARKARPPGIFCSDCIAREKQAARQSTGLSLGAGSAPKRNWSTVVHPPRSNRESMI